ncbi:class I SAM-dependent methyltransferase [bacterium]|nr:class I SAM-dependent methyltransferase [bacterium]
MSRSKGKRNFLSYKNYNRSRSGSEPLFSKNTPFVEEEVREYERKRYRGWDQKLVDKREQRILEKILHQTGLDWGKVLDVPCGYGRFSSLFERRGFSLLQCDLSFPMVKRARDQRRKGACCWGVVADIKNPLPFQSSSVALVLSMRFFHHVHHRREREHILREFFRVSGKWVVISFYRRNFLHFLQRKFRKKIKESPTRISMIPEKSFNQELQKEGFRLKRIYPLFKGLHAQHIALLEKV